MNKWSISSRTILLGLTPAFFMFVLLTGYYINDKFDVLQSQLNHKGELLVQQLAPATEYAVFIKNPGLLEGIVTPVLEDRDVAQVEIYDKDGELLLSRKDLSLFDPEKNDELHFFASDITLQDVPFESNDFDLGFSNQSEEDQSNTIGRISLGLTSQFVTQEQQDALVGGIIIGLGALLLSTVLALFIARTIARPIQALSNTVNLFQSGMLSARVDERSGGELGVLESNLNSMAGTLESAKRKELEHAMALEQARAEALSASRAKSEFLEQMSYELREPMNATIGSLQLLESSEPTDKQRRYIEQSISSSSLLVELIDNILDYSKLEVKSIKLESVEFDFKRMINRSMVPFIHLCNQKNIDTHVFFEGLEGNVLITTDRIQLQKIIYHTLDSSVRRTVNGNIDLRVFTEPTHDKKKLLIKIEIVDTGEGFSAEQLGNLLQISHQRHDINQPYKPNSGLGLTIAQKLTKLLGGTLNISSAPDKGTRFQFEFAFPFSMSRQIVNEDNTDILPSVSGRILVIESSSIDQLVTKEMLNKIGAIVDTATNGRIALEKIRQLDFGLVIVDSNIPDISIIDLIQRIRAFERAKNTQLPILVLTADIVHENHERIIDAGADDYLIKPINMNDIWQKVSTLMVQSEPIA